MTIRIPARFNGPDDSGNGGYTCGLVAAAVGAGPAEVSLLAPPPLERDLAVERGDDGAVSVTDGATVVATGRPVALEAVEPPQVSVADASAASAAGLGQWAAAHPFPRCVVCGPERGPGDGLEIFPGPLGPDGGFASVWTPEGEPGEVVADELVWAALDCPTSAPVVTFDDDSPPCVLARLAVSIDGEVRAGTEYAIVSWPNDVDGRKRHSGAALLGEDGTVLAHAEALWIELRAE